MNECEDGEDELWPIKFMEAIVQAHQVENLDSHSIPVRLEKLKGLSQWLVPIEVFMDLLWLVLLAAIVGCLLLHVEIPESDDEIKPEN